MGGLLLVAGAGCRESASTSRGASRVPEGAQSNREEHAHRAGTHGGLIVPIDGAHYHVEAILTAAGELRFLTLGPSEERVQEVDAQTITAYVRPRDDQKSRRVELVPDPQPGDAPGTTSAFVGPLPDGLAGRALVIVVPSLRIDGRRLRFGFELESERAEAMPEKVADEEERALYLTPGGKYTAADVVANGRTTASVKFAGFRAAHDPHPAPGAPICPITDTRANPSCSWIVGGEVYTFCCPPCVDEFVRRAKEDPASIRPSKEYVARESEGRP